VFPMGFVSFSFAMIGFPSRARRRKG